MRVCERERAKKETKDKDEMKSWGVEEFQNDSNMGQQQQHLRQRSMCMGSRCACVEGKKMCFHYLF